MFLPNYSEHKWKPVHTCDSWLDEWFRWYMHASLHAMYACVYIHIYIYTHYMYVCIFVCVYIYTYTCIHTHINICVCVCVCMYIYIHTHRHVLLIFRKSYVSNANENKSALELTAKKQLLLRWCFLVNSRSFVRSAHGLHARAFFLCMQERSMHTQTLLRNGRVSHWSMRAYSTYKTC